MRTYAHVLRLPSGRHRLWHGAKINTADTYHSQWPKGGFIEPIDVAPRIFPSFCDNRALRCPDDDAGQDGGEGEGQ